MMFADGLYIGTGVLVFIAIVLLIVFLTRDR